MIGLEPEVMEATIPSIYTAPTHLAPAASAVARASSGAFPRSACRSIAVTCGDVVGAAAATAATGLALIPAGRIVGWIGLLGLTIGLAHLAGRAAGITAAATSTLLYLSAHGRPRFAGTITDPTTIRLALLLGLAGTIGTFWVTVLRPLQVLTVAASTTTNPSTTPMRERQRP